MEKVAIKVSVNDLLTAPVTKVDNSSLLQVGNELVSTVNVIGTITSFFKDDKLLVLDDGSGSIVAQWFDTDYDVSSQDTVLIIGRLREFEKRYLFPEIIKSVDPLWLQVRTKEFGSRKSISKIKELPVEESSSSDIEKDALDLIHEYDDGSGADTEEIIKKIGEKGEDIIKRLLMAGEIFETRPGRIKIL